MAPSTKTYVPDYLILVDGKMFRHGENVDVLSVSVTETIGQSDSFSLSVREHNPTKGAFASNKLAWFDSDAFDEGNGVWIELGYQGNRALAFLGYITGMSASFPENGAPTLTVRGKSMYDWLMRCKSREPFESQKDSDIARELAKLVGLDAEVDQTVGEHPIVSPIGSSFAAILQDRANRLYFDFTVKKGTLIFKRPTYITKQDPELNLEWGRDLRSLSIEVSTSNMPTSVEVRNTQTGQNGAKVPLAAQATAKQVGSKLAKKSGPEIAQAAFGDSEVLSTDQRASSTAECQDVAIARMRQSAIEYAKVRGSCIGQPSLVSRKVIEIKGIGGRYSGKYYVTSTTHTIDANGYRTDFEAKSDGRNK